MICEDCDCEMEVFPPVSNNLISWFCPSCKKEIGQFRPSDTQLEAELDLEHQSVLLEAEGLVHGARNTTYGHPLDDFSRTAAMWSTILNTHVTPQQVGLCMIAVKLSRECHLPKRDNLVDIAGYAETVEWCKAEAYKRHILRETFAPVKESER